MYGWNRIEAGQDYCFIMAVLMKTKCNKTVRSIARALFTSGKKQSKDLLFCFWKSSKYHKFCHSNDSEIVNKTSSRTVWSGIILQSHSKLLGHFCVSLSPQCWCTRFGDWAAINNFERDKGSTRRKKTAFGLSAPTIFVWDCSSWL